MGRPLAPARVVTRVPSTGIQMSAAAPTSVAEGETLAGRHRATRRALLAGLLIALIVAYLWVFLTTRIGSLGVDPATGAPFTRLDFQLLLLQTPSFLVSQWTGGELARCGIVDRLPVLFGALLYFLAAYAPGRVLLRAFRADRGLTRLETSVFALGAGLNLLSLWTLALGLCGLAGEPLWLLLPSVSLAAFEIGAALRRRRVEGDKQQPPRASDRRGDRQWLWLATPFAAALLLSAMLPPWSYDARCYHLQTPKEWFLQGRIGFMPHNVYGNMPLGAEMHALSSMAFCVGERPWWWGALIGKTVIAGCTLLAALALLAFGKRIASWRAGAVAAVSYLSIPWIFYVSSTGLIDGVVSLYLLLAVYATVLWRREPASDKNSRVALAGFFAGCAAACKYPGLLYVAAPLAAYVLISSWRRGSGEPVWRKSLVAVCVFMGAVLAGCGLWLAKNAAVCGNPTYPLLTSVFGGRSAELDARWKRVHSAPTDEFGRRYSWSQLNASARGLWAESSWLSPLILPLAGLALLDRKRRATILLLLSGIVFVLGCWWLLTHRIDRFWLPALPLAALLAGLGVHAVRGSPFLRPAVNVLLILGLVSNLLVVTSRALGDNRYFVSLEQLRVDEPGAVDGFTRTHPAHRFINRKLDPRRHKVLLVGDAKPFDLETPALYNTAFDPSVFESLLRGRGRDERLTALRAAGITHLLVAWRDIEHERGPEGYGFSDFVTRRLVRRELVAEQRILRPVDIGVHPEIAELLEVGPW